MAIGSGFDLVVLQKTVPLHTSLEMLPPSSSCWPCFKPLVGAFLGEKGMIKQWNLGVLCFGTNPNDARLDDRQ